MSYIGDSINASPTIAERAGAAIPGGAGLAVKYDANGCIVPCATAGEPALGVIIMQQGDVAVGDSVTVHKRRRGEQGRASGGQRERTGGCSWGG